MKCVYSAGVLMRATVLVLAGTVALAAPAAAHHGALDPLFGNQVGKTRTICAAAGARP